MQKVMDGNRPYWSWCNVHAHNVQSERMTRLVQVKELHGYEDARERSQRVRKLPHRTSPAQDGDLGLEFELSIRIERPREGLGPLPLKSRGRDRDGV